MTPQEDSKSELTYVPQPRTFEEEETREKTFREKLTDLINCESRENDSDTPDFILANYLADCLRAYDRALQAREQFYGRPILSCSSYKKK